MDPKPYRENTERMKLFIGNASPVLQYGNAMYNATNANVLC